MEKKRGLPASYIILFCSLLFFSSFAIAEDPSEEALGRSAEIFGKVLYDVFSSAEKLFSSVSVSVNVDPGMVIYLYFIAILFFFVYAIVDSMNFFPDNWIIKGVVAIAITGLAYIALPANFYMFFLYINRTNL